MEEKLNNLVTFALNITGSTDNIVDYYAALQKYCCSYVHEPITQDFNDVIGYKGGVTLFYLKLQIFLLEQELIKNPDPQGEKDLQAYRERYAERFQEYIGKREGIKGL